ncbi:MAG: GHKL domain-containing protein [Lachnospiraceae bacterium]|nr:GHKL domain-containing protein [Lachnospiraceae bacterium]
MDAWISMNTAELILKVFSMPPVYIMVFTACMIFGMWITPFLYNKKACPYVVLVYTAAVFYLQLVPWNTNKIWDRLLAPSLAFAVMYFMDRRNMKQKIFLCGVYELITWLIAGIASEFKLFMGDITDSIELLRTSIPAILIFFVTDQLLYMVIFILMVYMSVKLLKKVYKRKYEDLSLNELILLMIPLITLILVRHIISAYYSLWMEGVANGSIQENIHANIYRLMFYIGAYIAVILFITTYQNIKNYEEDKKLEKLLTDRIEDTKSHINEVEKLYVDMRSIKHDMTNHIQVLKTLVEKNEIKQAEDYLSHMDKQVQEIGLSIKTGNPITDIIISEFDKRFKDENIDFNSSFFYPDNSKMDAFDISIILNNSLQNAYEAAQGLDNAYVNIRSFIKNNIYIIEVRNSFEKELIRDEDTGLYLSAKDGDNHGFGLRNIRTVAEKYYGDIDIEVIEQGAYESDGHNKKQNNEFRLLVMLQLT